MKNKNEIYKRMEEINEEIEALVEKEGASTDEDLKQYKALSAEYRELANIFYENDKKKAEFIKSLQQIPAYQLKPSYEFKETEVQKRTKFNEFEEEMREWATTWQHHYGFQILDGTVSDKEEITRDDHVAAKISKGDIVLKFGQLEFAISQKLSKVNKRKITVPGRVTFPLPTINYYDMKNRQEDFLILDTNEVKELRNGKGHKYLIYKDENYGGYFLYCKNDLQQFQASEVYLEPEGGKINLQDKYNTDRFHKWMTSEEGEPKRKHVIQKTYLKFDTLFDCMEWFMDNIVKLELYLHNKQQEELKEERYSVYKSELQDWVKSNKNRFIYSPTIEDNRLVILGKRDVLIKVQNTPKENLNDEVVSEYNLFSYDLLKLRDTFATTSEFMKYLLNTYIPEDLQTEAAFMLKTYSFKGKQQEFMRIVAPSPFKCPGATRKEAITCPVTYQVGKPKLLR